MMTQEDLDNLKSQESKNYVGNMSTIFDKNEQGIAQVAFEEGVDIGFKKALELVAQKQMLDNHYAWPIDYNDIMSDLNI